MTAIDPTSLALLAVLAATAVVIALHLVLQEARRRLDRRRWRTSDEVVIDLTFVHDAIRHDQEVARRIALTAGRRTDAAEAATSAS